jgi:hypothetical protein
MRFKVVLKRLLLLCALLIALSPFGALLTNRLAIRRDQKLNGRATTIASSRRTGTGEGSISIHREEITPKELHNLLIHRIYHEDNLLQQRNYNFITTNAFLGAGFAVVVAIEPTKAVHVSMFGYVLAVFGFLWALLQVA